MDPAPASPTPARRQAPALAATRRCAAAIALLLAAASAHAALPPARGAGSPPAASAASGAAAGVRGEPRSAPAQQLTLPAAGASSPGADTAASAAGSPGEGSVFFVGNATTLIRFGGITILTDPTFLHRGEKADLGGGITTTRLTDPALSIDQLPPVDLVLLSHFHGDHFDQVAQRRLDQRLPIVTPPQAAQKLQRLGFQTLRPLKTWQRLDVEKGATRLRITALPARHGPPVLQHALPQTMGSMVEFLGGDGRTAFTLYISGDTLVFDDLRQIPKRYPKIDLALLHLGGTRVGGVLVTMDAKQGVQAMQWLQPQLATPIHFDDYDVFKSPLEDFLREAERAGLSDRLRVLRRGESLRFTVPR